MENGDVVPIIGRNQSACYENPLFEEDGTVINETQTKLHRQPDGLRTKPYDLPNAAQTSVHYIPGKPRKRKGLYILGLFVAIIAIIAVITIVIVGQKDGSSEETALPGPRPASATGNADVYKTKIIEASVRIIQGPFSSFKAEYKDRSSSSYSLFSSSFTYQMNSILNRSDLAASYSHIEIVNISSGSVLVNFILHFSKYVNLYTNTPSDIASLLIDGFTNSLFLIDKRSVSVKPKGPVPSVISTSKPGVCVPLTSPSCVNISSWKTITFPNLLGHRSPAEAEAAEAAHQELLLMSCGKDFWCAVFNPKCKNNKPLPPCRSYCKVVFKSCGSSYQTEISSLLNCDDLPDSEDSSVCLQDPFKPGKCLPNMESKCQDLGYSKVGFPNYAGMRSPYEAADLLNIMYSVNLATKCYKHSLMFACTAMMPKCSGTGRVPNHIVPPCRSLCNAFKSRCSIFMDIFWYPWPKDLQCDTFPDSNDTNVCLGYTVAHEPIPLEECPAGESRCDDTTCIPLSWRCDGFKDCKDGSDERAIQTTLPIRKCVDCPADMFRCSFESAICIDKSRRCDGIEDCPTASDERECVKLGDGGAQGVLTVYSPSPDNWIPVCNEDWTKNHSDIVCRQLGYTDSSSHSAVYYSIAAPFFTLASPTNGSNPEYIASQLKRTKTCTAGIAISISCGLPVCGTRPAYIHPSLRVVGGDIADPNAWPWQVSVFGGTGQKYFCGGTIIAERWILTAGHCIGGRKNPEDLLFRAGQPRRDTYSPYTQEFHPEELFLHEGYNLHTVDNDIALIRLKESVRFNDHVRPICLPKTPEKLPVGTRCTVIGWGKQEDAAMDYERQIRQVNLEVTDWHKCKHAIENADIQVPHKLTDHMFCAGGGIGHDSCGGDSGGPFLCRSDKVKDTWFVAGIVSWGVACAYPNVPGVYTNVPGYLDWIRNITGLDYL